MNRTIAANAGREYALQMTKRLVANPKNKLARRALNEIGVNAQKIFERGHITPDEIIRVAQRVVNKTQFRSGILDLPLFFPSPEGKIIPKFKTFAFTKPKLIKDPIVL